MKLGPKKAFNIVLALDILTCLVLIVVGVLFETGTFSITTDVKKVHLVNTISCLF